jgi:hypothetical protein
VVLRAVVEYNLADKQRKNRTEHNSVNEIGVYSKNWEDPATTTV